ncbi:WSD1 family O-acyltransferase [Nocardia sp. CA2R105]|uniref:WS/DGAT domain-containing protein n=1 Tax=Nocardia coffeae TaxID=2873381 RepID=UPI001CA65821|nr:WS/DGAT domain-containing protein [Nocardia coffeae]MBY8855994.1 WSD1 family O-acyltransferase [Nocardia coffeae]
MNSLAPQDATRYWLSRRTVNDLFLLYCFTDAGHSFEQLADEVLGRAANIPDLCVRLREHRFAYPEWVPCAVSASQISEPVLGAPIWSNVIAAVEEMLSHGVRADEHPWRLHLFRGIRDAPGGDVPALVAVLQLSHALADGRRSAEIARALWGDAPGPGSARQQLDVAESSIAPIRSACRVVLRPVEAVALLGMPVALARTVSRGLGAERARRELEALTHQGEIPSPATDFPLTRMNHPPAPSSHAIRMLVREDLRVPGHTVTVVAATAISQALSRYLADHGEPNVLLGAQVSMALPAADAQPTRLTFRRRRTHPRNNYVDLAIELPAHEPDPHRRADRIAADLAARRTRALHPLMTARNAVTEVIPAPVLRRDIAGYPLDLTPEALSGHTVISSVNRGPADLTFATAPVRWTAGFPALGTVMHLTHGIHGLGNTVTVSIHADPDVIPDIDTYTALLDTALTETVAALRS